MSATPRLFAQTLRHIRAIAGEPGRLSDGQLLERFARDRDEGAFSELLRRHGPLVLGVARRRLGDRHSADDVFQATFLALTRQAPRSVSQGTLAGWLYTTASRLARKEQARTARRPQPLPDDPTTPAPTGADPLAEVSGRELVALIDDELARLPERYRLPLLLCGLEGLARDEAAARLGWSLGALRGRLERGRELLRTRLAARGLTVPAVFAGVLAADATVPRELIAATSRAALAALTAPVAWGSLKALAVGVVLLAGVGAGVGALASRERERPESDSQTPVAHAPGSPEQPAPRVDHEGVPLPPGVLARLGSSRMRHAGMVASVDIAPDGQSVASAAEDGVCVWDAATGRLLRRFEFRSRWDPVARFSADGRQLLCVTKGERPLFRRLDLASGRELFRAELDDKEGVDAAVISASRQRLAISDMPAKVVRVYDTATGAEICRIPFTGTRARSLAIGPDDHTIAVADYRETVDWYELPSGRRAGGVQLDGMTFSVVALAPDGRSLATIAANQQQVQEHVAIWDMATATVRHRLPVGKYYWANGLTFSPDGAVLAAGSPSGELVLWDTATGRERQRLRGLTGLHRPAFSRDGRTIAGGSNNGTVTLWDAVTGRRGPASADPITAVRDLRFAAGGQRLIGLADRPIVWDPATGRELDRLADVPVLPHKKYLSPDNRLLAAVTADRVIQVWDAVTGQEVRSLQVEPPLKLGALYFTPDSRRLLASAYEGDATVSVVVFDLADGRLLHRLAGPGGSQDYLTTSPDSRWLATAGPDRGRGYAIRLWDLSTFREVQRLTPPGSVYSLEFTPDSRRLAAGVEERGPPDRMSRVHLWDIDSGKLVRSCEGGPHWVSHLAFAPDGRMLATNGPDSTLVRLWEVATGGERHRFTGHDRWLHSMAFAPDGRTLAAASYEAPVYVWDVLGLSEFAARPPTAAELEQAWAALAGADAKEAFQAIRRLVAAPGPAVAFLRERLQPMAPADGQRVRELIRQLDGPRFAERQQATQELEALADRAAVELRAALKDAGTLELRQRLERLLDRIEAGTPEMLRAIRAVEALEYIGTPAARQHLTALAGGAAGTALTDAAAAALKRLEAKP